MISYLHKQLKFSDKVLRLLFQASFQNYLDKKICLNENTWKKNLSHEKLSVEDLKVLRVL